MSRVTNAKCEIRIYFYFLFIAFNMSCVFNFVFFPFFFCLLLLVYFYSLKSSFLKNESILKNVAFFNETFVFFFKACFTATYLLLKKNIKVFILVIFKMLFFLNK